MSQRLLFFIVFIFFRTGGCKSKCHCQDHSLDPWHSGVTDMVPGMALVLEGMVEPKV